VPPADIYLADNVFNAQCSVSQNCPECSLCQGSVVRYG